MFIILFLHVLTLFLLTKCAHIVNIDEDFNKIKADSELSKHVDEILTRIKTFNIPVHPRIRLFYELLKKGMRNYADRTADSLFVPDKYNLVNGNIA